MWRLGIHSDGGAIVSGCGRSQSDVLLPAIFKEGLVAKTERCVWRGWSATWEPVALGLQAGMSNKDEMVWWSGRGRTLVR